MTLENLSFVKISRTMLHTWQVWNVVCECPRPQIVPTYRSNKFLVLWPVFCLIGPISLCTDSFVFMCVYFVFFNSMRYCNTVRLTGWDWSLIFRTLSSFGVGWVFWHVKTCPRYDLCIWWDVKPTQPTNMQKEFRKASIKHDATNVPPEPGLASAH